MKVIDILIIYIYRNILSWNNIEKTHLATWGLEPASPVSVVNRHTICSIDHHILNRIFLNEYFIILFSK